MEKDKAEQQVERKAEPKKRDPEAIVVRLQEGLDRATQRLERTVFRWRYCLLSGAVGASLGGGIFLSLDEPPYSWSLRIGAFLFGAIVAVFFYFGILSLERIQIRQFIVNRERLLAEAGISTLRESIEDDFFTKLVKINFKYIDQYYLQTQSQAEKSFSLCAWVAGIGVLIIVAGIVLMYIGKTTPAYVTTASGILSEFISAVFFYLYNRTILKMSQYHQKLVITQNISLALKIAEGLPEADRVKAQQDLISRLTDNVNKYLTEPFDQGSARTP